MSLNIPSTPAQAALHDLTTLKAMGQRVTERCPDLRQMARETASQILRNHVGSDLDPDNVYWHRFVTTESSRRTFNGWQHRGTPIESMTLPQLTLHRFNVRNQIAADELQLMSGFYTAGPKAMFYDERNEVRMLPVAVMNDFWNIDFCALYHTRLDTFWRECAEDYRTLAKATFLSRALEERKSGALSELDFQTVIRGVANNVNDPLSLAMLQASTTAPVDIRVTGFDIGGYLASDILRITTAQGRQILYLPGDIIAFRAFDTAEQLHLWLLDETAQTRDRARFLGHFQLSMRQEKDRDVGLDHLMDLLDTTMNHSSINQLDQALGMDAFTWLRDAARLRMNADAAISMHSNSDLRKQIWIGYLNAFSHVMGPMAAMDWPIALAVVGAGLADLGLNIDQAINGRTTAERKAGVIGAIASGIDVLFNSLLLAGEFPQIDGPSGAPAASLNTEPNIIGGPALEPAPPLLQSPTIIAEENPDPLAPFQTDVVLDEAQRVHEDGPMQGIYRMADGSTFISIQGTAYRVRYASEAGCWIIIDHENPYSFFKNTPVRLNAAGQWKPTLTGGLRGGGPTASRMQRLPEGTGTSEYDVPQSHRPQLRSAANGQDRRALSGDYVDINTLDDPYVEFRAIRERLRSHALDFFTEIELPARPVIPQLETASTTKSVLRQLYEQAPGLVIGESHDGIGSKRFLIENMRLLKKLNVRTLYMEHLLTDFHLTDLQAFADTGQMSSALEIYLRKLDLGHLTDPSGRYTFLALVKAARDNHVRIQPIDCMASYRLSGVDDPYSLLRNQTMNYFAQGIIRNDAANLGLKGKWIALVGNSHANTFKGVPGISELDGAIGIRIEDVAAGAAEGFSTDPGALMQAVNSPQASMVKCDFRLKIAVTRAQSQVAVEDHLISPGMFIIDISGDNPVLIHRTKEQTIVRTPIRLHRGEYSINRPAWPAISGRAYDSLAQLVDALKLMGMTHAN